LIVLDIIGNVSPRFLEYIDLDNIEPFTIVLFQELLFNSGGMERSIKLRHRKNILVFFYFVPKIRGTFDLFEAF
jgi:hypothetical protein